MCVCVVTSQQSCCYCLVFLLSFITMAVSVITGGKAYQILKGSNALQVCESSQSVSSATDPEIMGAPV